MDENQAKRLTYLDLVQRAYRNQLLLPNIQRGIAWEEDDILLLVDSVLRGYPIGSIFIWTTESTDIRCRRFVPEYNAGDMLPGLLPQYDTEELDLVLDGQQRIQSMLIALRGQYNGRRCYIRLKQPAENRNTPKELLYELAFLKDVEAQDKGPEWCALGECVFRSTDVATRLGEATGDLGMGMFHQRFDTTASIIYCGVKRDIDEIANIFIRVNQAGEPLTRADLIMALLSTRWDTVKESFVRLARELDFGVDADFVLRASLFYLKRPFDFRNVNRVASQAEEIRDHFPEIEEAIKQVVSIAREAVDGHRTLVGRTGFALLPLLEFHKLGMRLDREINRSRVRYWLHWCQLVGRFSRWGVAKVRRVGATQFLAKGAVPEKLPVAEMVGALAGHYSHVLDYDLRDPQHVLKLGKESPGRVLGMFQRERRQEADRLGAGSYHLDHIFPYSKLKARDLPDEQINRLGNLRLCFGLLNEQKRDQDPEDYIRDKSDGELEREFGVRDRSLFCYERYDQFVGEREKVIARDVTRYVEYS